MMPGRVNSTIRLLAVIACAAGLFTPPAMAGEGGLVAAADSILVAKGIAANYVLPAEAPEGTALTFTVVRQPKAGTVTLTDQRTGAYSYAANADAGETDSFTFKVSDGTAEAAVAEVSVALVDESGTRVQMENYRIPPDRKPYRVYLAVWRGWEDACQGLKDYFVKENIPLELSIRNAGGDKTKLAGFVAEARKLGVDLVITWGTSTTLGILGTYDGADPAKNITKIPAVFMIVSQPVRAKVVPDFSSSGRNVTGVSYLVTEENQLKAARSYLSFDKLAVIYNELEPNSKVNVETLKALSEQEGFQLIALPVPLGEDGKPMVEAIEGLVAKVAKSKPVLLYQGPDSFLNVNRDILTGAALVYDIPVLAAGENPVRFSNALMGVINRYYTVGQLAAFKAKQVLVDGKNPKDIPIEAPKRFSFMINIRVAKELELYPPMNILKFAEIVTGETAPFPE